MFKNLTFLNKFLEQNKHFILGTILKRRLGGGYKKYPETFTSSRFEETRGGRVPQKPKIWADVFYGWSLIELIS